MIKRSKGERYRPIVTVAKEKNGIPTVVEISGGRYTLTHPTHIRGNQEITKKRSQRRERNV